MNLHSPHKFAEHIRQAMFADPSIAQNEVEARHREVTGYGKGHGGWRDRIAVFIGLGILAVFTGGFLWNLYGP